MRKVTAVMLLAGATASWVGCQQAANPPAETRASSQQTPATDVAATEGNTVLVSLNVPNMVWGGCAASVRGDLEKIEGVTDIQTDPRNRVCSFKVTDPNVDYKAKLAEFAKDNSHLAGYEIQ